MRNKWPFSRPKAKGSALMLILIILGLATALLVSALKSNPQIERDKITADALAKAKDALIGYAIIYRDTHPDTGGNRDKVFGYLPCPDTDNDGETNSPCSGKGVTVAGRLPWKTLGLPPLRDSAGECLWYIISGSAKNNPPADVLNWDTVGQIEVHDASGQVLVPQNTHDTPWAVIIGPGSATGTQDRNPAGTSECGGNNNAAAYLEGLTLNPAAGGVSTFVLATSDSARNGTNNDRGLWIASREIFDRVKKRSDFASDISTLLTDLKTSLDAAAPPLVTAFNTASTAGCPVADAPTDQKKDYFRCKWNNNLKFAESIGITVNGAPCDAVLIFAGERATGQIRVTQTDRLIKGNYLEAPILDIFPGGGAYSGASVFDPTHPVKDIVRCIKTGSAPPPPPIVGGTPITLDATTITAACSGVCENSGIDTGVTTLALAGTPALTITATGGTIGRNLGGAATDAIGVYGGSGGAPDTALQSGESLSFRLTGNTAQKFGITLYDFDTGEQALLTFKNNGTVVGTYTATTATTANINPGGTFDEVVVQAIGAAAFWVQTVKFCDAATSC
jgi:type II secretory pathway pseudopilin PulG